MNEIDKILISIKTKFYTPLSVTIACVLTIVIIIVAMAISDTNERVFIIQYNKPNRFSSVSSDGNITYLDFNIPKGKYRIINLDDKELFLIIESNEIYQGQETREGYAVKLPNLEDKDKYIIDTVYMTKAKEEKIINIDEWVHVNFVSGDRAKFVLQYD